MFVVVVGVDVGECSLGRGAASSTLRRRFRLPADSSRAGGRRLWLVRSRLVRDATLPGVSLRCSRATACASLDGNNRMEPGRRLLRNWLQCRFGVGSTEGGGGHRRRVSVSPPLGPPTP